MRVLLAPLLVVLIAGCSFHSSSSSHQTSVAFNGTKFSADDKHNYILVAEVGQAPPRWDEITLTNRGAETVRVRLNADPTSTTGHAIRSDASLNLEAFGAGTVHLNDKIKFCTLDEDGSDVLIEFLVAEEVGATRHMVDHTFDLRLNECR